ncbi:hypothetical protein [Bacillus sp. UMB0728]|uniref:hypothetical protein n=1 Tax=Bacillus sp. UMB0728 TaxID=2066052 RepID=UPI000C784D10|nr:hypothetical protein [Bacillus sp. UMB0728]PLR72187.1 hypothetical protein CYJ37_11565 [Bacillus sp. UMB0728]
MVKDYTFSIGQEVVLVSDAKDLIKERGEKATIIHLLPTDYLNDYLIKLENGEETKVKQREIQAIPEEMLDISTGDKVIYVLANEEVIISKTDFFHGQVEIEFNDGSHVVVGIEAIRKIDKGDGQMSEEKVGYFESRAHELGKLVDTKQAAYGDSVSKASQLMKVFLQDYKNDNNTYTIPEELLDHILLQVRIIDKQNRIFSNPKADKMNESPYSDISGYGLLGERMQNN